jgi:peptide chain release factor 2
MEELNQQAESLNDQLKELEARLGFSDLEKQLTDLKLKSEAPDFWQDPLGSQGIMKQIARLDNRVSPILNLKTELNDALEMIKLNDTSLERELSVQLDKVSAKLDDLKEELKFIGPYDDHDAIISIYAGAGGTDAQDWTQMLFRMYSRYFEKSNWKTEVVEESSGDEAGLKTITLEVEGDFAYGKLKGEQGVHRLVRLSPFNSDNLRQTSFAKVEITPKIDQPEELEIDEKDLKIDVYRSGGHGGQSVNTTDSAVRITHIPTNIAVAIQNERSQLQNRETAMTILRSKLAKLQLEQHAEKLSQLKGPNQSAEWGNQIRSYVLHPYKQVKDLRTRQETSDVNGVLDGNIEPFIEAYLNKTSIE